MAAGKKQYVYRLMKAQCTCGDKKFKQNLNLKKDHGVLFHDENYPLMNANDHVANENIFTFGRCTSTANPNGAIGSGLANAVIPIVGGLLMRKLAGVKCEPMTIVPWIKIDEDYLIDGAPALTLESELPCYYGGVIKIVLEKADDNEDEQDGADESEEQEAEEERDIKEQLPSEVQEKLDSFCDGEFVEQSAGEEALAAEGKAEQGEITTMDIPQIETFQMNEFTPVTYDEKCEISYNMDYISSYLEINGKFESN